MSNLNMMAVIVDQTRNASETQVLLFSPFLFLFCFYPYDLLLNVLLVPNMRDDTLHMLYFQHKLMQISFCLRFAVIFRSFPISGLHSLVLHIFLPKM